MKNNNSTIMIISIVILLVAVVILVVYLIKSNEKLEINLGAKKDKSKLYILNKYNEYRDLSVTVREGDVILYSAPIGPDRMTPPITVMFNDGADSTVLHTNIYIAGSIYPKRLTVSNKYDYTMIIDKDYDMRDNPQGPTAKPKIVVTEKKHKA